MSLGCPKNLVDSERMLGLLQLDGYKLVADPDAGARRIVEFLGLPWDDACLRFYEAERAVSTASVDQVRKPIYTSSVSRWKRYERRLGPLLAALRQCGVPLHDAPDAHA